MRRSKVEFCVDAFNSKVDIFTYYNKEKLSLVQVQLQMKEQIF